MDNKKLERLVKLAAAEQSYPPTPDLAGRIADRRPVGSRGWAWAAAVLLVAVLALLSVPEVRARVLEFLRIGAVQIQLPGMGEDQLSSTAPPTATPGAFLGKDLLDSLSGETTLQVARSSVDFPIPLPTYPDDLGEPQRVFLQHLDAVQDFVILVWGPASEAELALYVIGPDIQLTKGPPQILQELEISGRPAAYVDGHHLLVLEGFHQFERLVDAPALIWEGETGITYRLEGDLALEELVRIAESIE